MLTLSATDLAIATAAKNGTLSVTKEAGRFGSYWAISDGHGLIEVALSASEAAERTEDIHQRVNGHRGTTTNGQGRKVKIWVPAARGPYAG